MNTPIITPEDEIRLFRGPAKRKTPHPVERVVLWIGFTFGFYAATFFLAFVVRDAYHLITLAYPDVATKVILATLVVGAGYAWLLLRYRFGAATMFGIVISTAITIAAYQMYDLSPSSQLALEIGGAGWSLTFFFLGPRDNWRALLSDADFFKIPHD